MSQIISSDILVIGSGLAGSVAALRCAELGLKVTLLSKASSASAWAQGGIVLSESSDRDQFISDVMSAGCELNNRKAVELLADQGPELVHRWLVSKLQVPFDRAAGGDFHYSLEAAHKKNRIVHIGDRTGSVVIACAHEALRKEPLITPVQGTLIDLMLTSRNDSRKEMIYSAPQVCGAYVYDESLKEVKCLVAKAVILCSGGYSQIYSHSTGPLSSRGDGISAAQRVGARTLHMEYVQFHPTALYVPGQPRTLLTEALRGAGAKILNLEGERFVDEMAPRDQVARAIWNEILKYGPDSYAYLDLRSIPNLDEFPLVQKNLQAVNLDPKIDLIPIVPAAHFSLGGVWTDLDAKTNVPGLYAAGEVACSGVHGANRLASTSLLECLVFGHRAAEKARADIQNLSLDFVPRPWRYERQAVDESLLKHDMQFLRQTMWNYVGLVRSERRLKRAESALSSLRNEVEGFYKNSVLSDDLIGLRHAVLVANLVLYSALRNRESLGTHYLRAE